MPRKFCSEEEGSGNFGDLSIYGKLILKCVLMK
jgi:hypothetical protein